MDERRVLIKNNLRDIMAALPKGVTLLGASKTVPAEYINFAADCGLKVVGENRVNELLEKYDLTPAEIVKKAKEAIALKA